MSFCYLLNAALLFAGVLGFIIAGFAGTFARSLYGRRYRLMLGPLGFVVLGSIAHSVTARLLVWYSHTNPAFHITHPAGLGSGADIFETVMMLGAGLAGVLCGVTLGATLDREPVNDATYTIANYWKRRARANQPATAQPTTTRKENVIAISKGFRQAAFKPADASVQIAATQSATMVETAISKTE